MKPGDPVHGELHSADASGKVAVTLYEAGSNTARTLGSTEYLDVDSIEIITATGGDAYVYLGTVAAGLVAGQVVIRGTFAANSGLSMSFDTPRSGAVGKIPVCVAPAGVVDVVLTGRIRKA
jgi:hypothetical protein